MKWKKRVKEKRLTIIWFNDLTYVIPEKEEKRIKKVNYLNRER